jgi:hypothetical protein
VKKNGLCLTAAILVTVGLTGCKSPLNKYEGVFDRYYATTLTLSTSGDVLAMIQNPDDELLSQSESVVASWGKEGKKDRTHWFNMVAFDEEAMTAVRKYAFILEETQTRGGNRTPQPALRYDAEMVMSGEVLDNAYASNNAKLLAVLTEARRLFKQDSAEVTFDSDVLRGSVMMVHQAMNTVITKLTQSPAYAAQMPLLEGMSFDHPTLGESRIRLVVEENIVKVKIKAGKSWFQDGFEKMPFETHPDVQNM